MPNTSPGGSGNDYAPLDSHLRIVAFVFLGSGFTKADGPTGLDFGIAFMPVLIGLGLFYAVKFVVFGVARPRRRR